MKKKYTVTELYGLGPQPLPRLPLSVWSRALTYCAAGTVFRCSLVCSGFQSLVLTACPVLVETHKDRLDAKALEHLLLNCVNICILDLSGPCASSFTDDLAATFMSNNAHSIYSVAVSGCESLESFPIPLSGLAHLSLNECYRLDHIECFGKCPALSRLDISNCEKLDVELLSRSIAAFPSLAWLEIRDWNAVSRLAFRHSNLQHLDVSGCKNLKFLSLFTPKLQELVAVRCESMSADSWRELISSSPLLQYVTLSTGAGIRDLEVVSNVLKNLVIRPPSTNLDTLVVRAPALGSIALSAPFLSAVDLVLGELPKLAEIELYDCTSLSRLAVSSSGDPMRADRQSLGYAAGDCVPSLEVLRVRYSSFICMLPSDARTVAAFHDAQRLFQSQRYAFIEDRSTRLGSAFAPFSQLKSVLLYECPDPTLDVVLFCLCATAENLEVLTVWNCPGVEHLHIQSRNVKEIVLRDCRNIRSFSLHTAQLRSLTFFADTPHLSRSTGKFSDTPVSLCFPDETRSSIRFLLVNEYAFELLRISALLLPCVTNISLSCSTAFFPSTTEYAFSHFPSLSLIDIFFASDDLLLKVPSDERMNVLGISKVLNDKSEKVTCLRLCPLRSSDC
eukprot:ANDGO_04697.mRNA.1 hypothetical protein